MMIKLMAIILALIMLLPGCGAKSETLAGIDVSSGTWVTELDDHGGFHGDGTRFAEVAFSDNSCLDQISESGDWKSLPMSDTVRTLVCGIQEGGSKYGPMVSDENGEGYIPDVQNGYYRLIDRSSEAAPNEDESAILARHSFNFTVAVYDSDENILYYVECDT